MNRPVKQKSAPNILMISPVPTHPQDAGNRARIFQLAEELVSLGCDLSFAFYPLEGGDLEAMRAYWGQRLIELPCRFKPRALAPGFFSWLFKRLESLTGMGFKKRPDGVTRPLNVDAWYDTDIEEPVMHLHSLKAFDLVWVEYVFLSRVLERFDDRVTKFIDTHDIFSNRHELLIQQGLEPEWFSTTIDQEKKGLGRADVVITIQYSEAEFLRNLGLSKVLPIGHFPPWPDHLPCRQESNILLFAASDNSINVKSWEIFVREVLPLIKERLPELRIHVAGRICRRIADSPDYIKLGIVQDLSRIYTSSLIAINPCIWGTGLSIKSLEPLAYGCPLVTTPHGIRGLEDGEGQGILVGENKKEFVNHLEKLFRDGPYRQDQGFRARRYIHDYIKLNRQRLAELLVSKGT